MDLYAKIRVFPNKWVITEAPDSPGRLQKHKVIRRGVSFPIFLFLSGQSISKMDLYAKIRGFLNKWVITEAPISPERLQKHTVICIGVSFPIFLFSSDQGI